MRLKPEEIKIIKNAVHQFDSQARIILFGSRTDPKLKGGDIDLLILSEVLRDIDSIQILKEIYKKMEEQKIDILISSDTKDPFIQIALEKGVEI